MIRLGSRGSDLALTQSRQVAKDLEAATGESVEIEIFTTKGDQILDRPLPEIGGKGLFTEELEQALRDGRIDLAVHSLKDLPVEDAPGLTVGAVPKRAAVVDVLVYDPRFHDDEAGTLPLPDGSIVGTSSPRREAAIRSLRPGLEVRDLRGNVPTRVNKVREGLYRGIILARAGLDRLQLDLDGLVAIDLPTERFVPAPGQGALGVQCRADDGRVLGLLQSIHDERTAACVRAERQLLLALGGGCSMPFGALATPLDGTTDDTKFELRAALAQQHGSPVSVLHRQFEGPDLGVLLESLSTQLRPLALEPLRGRSIVLVRPGGSDPAMQTLLAVAGAEVESVALTETLPIAPEMGPLGALPDGVEFDLVVTSARAVDRWFEEIAFAGLALERTAIRRAFAVGPATRRALEERGLDAQVPESPGGGEDLARFIAESIPTAERRPLLFPCASDRRPAVESILGDQSFELHALPLYRTEVLLGTEWPTSRCDAVVWTSPSSVDAAVGATGLTTPETDVHVALGSATAEALRDRGLGPVTQAASPVPGAVFDTLCAVFGTNAQAGSESRID